MWPSQVSTAEKGSSAQTSLQTDKWYNLHRLLPFHLEHSAQPSRVFLGTSHPAWASPKSWGQLGDPRTLGAWTMGPGIIQSP